MTTLWKNCYGGEGFAGSVSADLPEGQAVVLYQRPDWVRYPPELGGGVARVVTSYDVSAMPCPKCGEVADRVVLRTEHERFVVACQDGCGYVWFQLGGEP